MSGLLRSWVESANNAAAPFPLNNLPYGVFSVREGERRCGVAIGDHVLDVAVLEQDGLIGDRNAPFLSGGRWNDLMARGPEAWAALRGRLLDLLAEGAAERGALEPHLFPQTQVHLHMPFEVAEYTDFYSSRQHATNVGTMFRGTENALPPNWLHIPIGYNGRASSVVVSGSPVRRPWGQLKGPDEAAPRFAPCEKFDFELELGAIVGTPSDGPITVAEAEANIFGYVLLNDWSARDIQAWEYQPLGPFQAKATATTISPWIITSAALGPFRRAAPKREVPLLPYLREDTAALVDIDLSVTLTPEGKGETAIAYTNASALYYSAAQQLAHHAISGCPMRCGDLLGSGTISGEGADQRGSLLELSWGGKDPLLLDTGGTRSFLEDGDTLTLHGAARSDGYTLGFGACTGKVLPALTDPYER